MSGRDITEEHDMANKHRNVTDTNTETKAALTNKQTNSMTKVTQIGRQGNLFTI